MLHRAEDVQARLIEIQHGGGVVRKANGSGKPRPLPGDLGLKAPTQTAKSFVLDTNVLLHDPACLGRFTDNHICIPVDVLAELDRFKTEQSERGANARKVHRKLTEMFSCSQRVTEGVTTEGGGTIRLVVYDSALCPKNSDMLQRFHRIFPDKERVDHRILACTLLLMAYNKAPVVLVTKDLNMQLKARAVGIDCQDYLNDKVDAREVSSYDVRRIEVEGSEMQRFASWC
jgi:PhoH-like ATPase